MMVRHYIGFHGTGVEAAEKIMETQKFVKSTGLDELLGNGVYFFQYPLDAKWWCQAGPHRKNYQTGYRVLQTELTPNSVVDLLGSFEDIENFKRFCDIVRNKSLKLPNGKKRSNYMSLAIKLMCFERKVRIDMIVAGFNQNRKFWYANNSPMVKSFPIQVTQVQYCVLNTLCIGQITEYEERCVENE